MELSNYITSSNADRIISKLERASRNCEKVKGPLFLEFQSSIDIGADYYKIEVDGLLLKNCFVYWDSNKECYRGLIDDLSYTKKSKV
jgi:hypothetical protein